jgi:hypothetical protein
MLDRLIELLRLIENNPDIKDYEDGLIPSNHPDVAEAGNIADAILITIKGGIDWDAVDLINDHGYSVFPLERDRFGWLLGGIATKKGIISFG